MITIAGPNEHIAKVWGTQLVKFYEAYRIMKYVFRVDYHDEVLLCNTITGHLVVLDSDEKQLLNQLPQACNGLMTDLIYNHFLVPIDYNESEQVIKLQKVLHCLLVSESHDEAIIDYTILPTTACNARCYYCYEHGIPVFTMTDTIVHDTVRFIADHCGPNKKVNIRWFGGEPTVAAYRIDQICKELYNYGIVYSSTMTTNGYLFDEEMVSRAKRIWNLKSVMICVDGTENSYNNIKSFVNPKDNPFQRVMKNIGLLLEHGIKVGLRMNFDVDNYLEFKDVLKEVKERFNNNPLLQVYAFPVKGEFINKNGFIHHGSDDWFNSKIPELNDVARSEGLFKRNKSLPSLFYSFCKAGDPSCMVITPKGNLSRCTGIFSRPDQIIGNVKDGINNTAYRKTWSKFGHPQKCVNCVFFPSCVLIDQCPGKGKCFLKETTRQYEDAVINAFNTAKNS